MNKNQAKYTWYVMYIGCRAYKVGSREYRNYLGGNINKSTFFSGVNRGHVLQARNVYEVYKDLPIK